MKHFSVRHLDQARSLYEQAEAKRWSVPNMRKDDQRLHCEYWTSKAREILDRPHLAEADRQACLWVLGVVRAIVRPLGIYIHGLSRDHTDNWAERARSAKAQLRAREARQGLRPASKPATKKVPNSSPDPIQTPPGLAGATIVVVGGEPDNVLLEHFRDAGFTLDWTPANIRQVQATVERIKLRKVTGVIFLADLNRHANFFLVRDACRLSSTPLIMGTKGLAAMKRALEQLSEQKGRLPKSA